MTKIPARSETSTFACDSDDNAVGVSMIDILLNKLFGPQVPLEMPFLPVFVGYPNSLHSCVRTLLCSGHRKLEAGEGWWIASMARGLIAMCVAYWLLLWPLEMLLSSGSDTGVGWVKHSAFRAMEVIWLAVNAKTSKRLPSDICNNRVPSLDLSHIR